MTIKFTHSVIRGVPAEVFEKIYPSSGLYAKGREAAMKALQIGRGHTVKETFEFDQRNIASFTSGARAVNKKYGSPLKVMQRKTGNTVNMYIVYKSDLEVN